MKANPYKPKGYNHMFLYICKLIMLLLLSAHMFLIVSATLGVETLVYPCLSDVDETFSIFILVSDFFSK